jgi:hypothetical protein
LATTGEYRVTLGLHLNHVSIANVHTHRQGVS